MKITGFIKQTLKDYSPLLAAEIFTAGCNYHCPTCHAKHIVEGAQNYSEKEVLDYLKETRGFIDGFVVCGGEPTLQYDLPDFLRKVKKETGLPIKLDTNGSNPVILGELLEEKLVDYVAMDIKGPPSLYQQIIGIKNDEEYFKRFDFRDNFEKAVNGVQNFPDYEFRTTLVPIYSQYSKEFRWMNPEDALEMADYVKGFIFTDPKSVKWFVQKFEARSEKEIIDKRFSKENLPKEYHETPLNVLENFKIALRTRFPKTEIR